jgi:hypothetical protein
MSLSIGRQCKKSQLCRDRQHVSDMSATYPAKIMIIKSNYERQVIQGISKESPEWIGSNLY